MKFGIKALVLACVCGWMMGVPARAQEAAALEDLLKDIEPAPAETAAPPTSAEAGAPESGTAAVVEELPAEAAPAAEFVAEPAIEPEAADIAVEEGAVEEAVPVEPAPVEEVAIEPALEAGVVEEVVAEPQAVEEPVAGAEEGIVTLVPEEEAAAGAEVMEEPIASEEPVTAVEEPVAAVEEPVAAAEEPAVEPAATMEEPAAAAEEPAAAVEEPVTAVETPAAAVEEVPVAPIWEEAPAAPAEPTVLSEPAAVWEGEEAPAEAEAEPATVEAVPEAEVEAAPEAEAEPTGEKAPKKKISAKEARQVAEQEEVKRQALQIDGERQLQAGYTALQAKDYPAAAAAFEATLDKLPDRPQNVALRERARWGKAEAYYQIAADQIRKDNLKTSRENVEKALREVPEHRPAAVLLKRIEKEEARALLPVPPPKRPEVVERAKTITELLGEARQYFDLEDYNKAERLYEQVLLQDEYNVEAMRFLRRIDERRYKRRTTERNATIADMVQQVRDTWNPPVRDEVGGPERVLGRETVVDKTATQKLQEKLSKIIIPSLEFRQANIHDVVKFLVDASIAGDPDGIGVNILLNLNVPGSEGGEAIPAPTPSASAPAPAAGGFDEFDEFFQEPAMAAPAAAPAVGVRTITLNLRRVSLLDAIKYITEVANLKFRIEENVVIITPAGVVWGRVITRMYPVQPSILDVIVEKEETEPAARTGEFIEMGGGKQTMKRSDVKDFFEKAGVPFPAGTSITYNPTISQLIVANTAENLDTFERILAQLNVIPTQVEIEARFVEVNQSDLEELGLQWILTDNWEIAQKQGIAPIAGQERVQINADEDGFTKGLRFFAFDNTTLAVDPASATTISPNQKALGGILTAASVLTNPELSVVLQALSQSGHSDLLSAPRITTRSGVNAQIQVVKEIIYPTEFEVTQPTVQSQGDLVTPPTVTPGAFQTREVGVILNVTPTVGPDGYTIDITMVPEVAELVDWIQYGSEITLETGTAEARQTRTFKFNIPQPIFSSRNVTTSLVIWDGQTVVMGGLIREELVTIKDKIPFLGDIPVLGRLFRSEGQKSRKTNLLIFVTARLVDPAGRPLHKAETRAMPGGGVQTGEGATAVP